MRFIERDRGSLTGLYDEDYVKSKGKYNSVNQAVDGLAELVV